LKGTGRRRGHRGALLGQWLPVARAQGRSLGAAATGGAGMSEPPGGDVGGAGFGEPLGAAATGGAGVRERPQSGGGVGVGFPWGRRQHGHRGAAVRRGRSPAAAGVGVG